MPAFRPVYQTRPVRTLGPRKLSEMWLPSFLLALWGKTLGLAPDASEQVFGAKPPRPVREKPRKGALAKMQPWPGPERAHRHPVYPLQRGGAGRPVKLARFLAAPR